jgi:hypothetical protein
MDLVVVSEHIRGVGRQGSSIFGAHPETPERKVPAGVMHGMDAGSSETLCGQPVAATWYVWRALTFPRSLGNQCPSCYAAARSTTLDVRVATADGSSR